MFFAFLAVAYFLRQDGAPLVAWGLLILWGLIWPHLARWYSAQMSDPLAAEIRNLYIDAFMIGFWVPLMSFNLVPSVAILFMHLLSIMSVMGLRACALGLLTELAGMAIAILLFGLRVEPQSELVHLMISLPMLVMYPLFVGYNAYSLSVKLAAKQQVLRQLSRVDGLTGLYNRMHWEEQVAREFARVKRGGPMACMVFVDVDWFKEVNDQYGHLVGDEVLRNMAHALLASAREVDICGRYGGEEFGILLPATELDNAMGVAERLREDVAATCMHEEHEIRLTISVGVAELAGDLENYSQWLEKADRALYEAKEQGRNRIVCAA